MLIRDRFFYLRAAQPFPVLCCGRRRRRPTTGNSPVCFWKRTRRKLYPSHRDDIYLLLNVMGFVLLLRTKYYIPKNCYFPILSCCGPFSVLHTPVGISLLSRIHVWTGNVETWTVRTYLANTQSYCPDLYRPDTYGPGLYVFQLSLQFIE